MSDMAVCPDCEGSGEVLDYWNHYLNCAETKPCNFCKGRGEVPYWAIEESA